MGRSPKRFTALAIFWLLLAGCHGEAESDQALQAIASNNTTDDATESDPTEPSITNETDGPPDDESLPLVATNEDTYLPPFPERMELFSPPSNRTQAAAPHGAEADDEGIELRGFANVNEPKAILAINGIISPIAVGQEMYGVRVLSINEPKVELQRGRERWIESLE